MEIFTEPDGQLMVIVVVDTNTLLIYEGTTLKWSAQFPYTPVSIARAHFQVGYFNCKFFFTNNL